jgi:hypothetical protein
MREMGGQRAMDKMNSMREKLRELHNLEGSMVREDEKVCWDGALAAWKRAGMPVKRGSGDDSTAQERRIILMMVEEQYNLMMLQELVGKSQDVGRTVFSEEDFGLIQWVRASDFDPILIEMVVMRAGEAASFI